MYKINFSIVLAAFLVIGCSSDEEVNHEFQQINSLELLESIVEENQFYTDKSFDGISHYLYDYSNIDDELPEEVLQELRINDETTYFVTKDGMIEDVQLFHQVLKYKYAMYEFTGGDVAFEGARDSLLKELATLNDETEMRNIDFVNLIRKHYSFIIDRHFRIDRHHMDNLNYNYYTTDEYHFTTVNQEEFYLKENVQKKLIAINGDGDVASYLMPSLSEDGEIVFVLGVFSEDPGDLKWTFTLADSNGVEDISTNLNMVSFSTYFMNDKRLQLTEKNNIAFLQMRTMTVLETDGFDYYDIINTGNELKGVPYLVLDLRSNFGGNVGVVYRWLEAFFDEPVNINSQQAFLFSNTGKAFVEDTMEFAKQQGVVFETFGESDDDYYRFEQFDHTTEPVWDVYDDSQTQQIKNNNTHIFVLIDNGTASAAEVLLTLLKQVNNTTIIGVNSAGAVSSGNALLWQLPNSDVKLSVPVLFDYHPNIVAKEGIGIQPDLWVHPSYSEDRVIKFIENYYLEK